MLSQAKFRKHVAKIEVPQGFVASTETVNWGWTASASHLVFVLKSDAIELRFEQTGSGHTNFLKDGNWLSFDRLGVEDSFYHLPLWDGDSTVYDLNEIVQEQIARVAEYLEQAAKAIHIPGIPFTVQPEKLSALKSQLAKQGRVSFMPSGFGIGYTISKRGFPGTKRASTAMEKFFGSAPLYISTFEAD